MVYQFPYTTSMILVGTSTHYRVAATSTACARRSSTSTSSASASFLFPLRWHLSRRLVHDAISRSRPRTGLMSLRHSGRSVLLQAYLPLSDLGCINFQVLISQRLRRQRFRRHMTSGCILMASWLALRHEIFGNLTEAAIARSYSPHAANFVLRS